MQALHRRFPFWRYRFKSSGPLFSLLGGSETRLLRVSSRKESDLALVKTGKKATEASGLTREIA